MTVERYRMGWVCVIAASALSCASPPPDDIRVAPKIEAHMPPSNLEPRTLSIQMHFLARPPYGCSSRRASHSMFKTLISRA